MATLIQCVNQFIDNITVTDRQEESIKGSISNIESFLKDKENDLNVERTFTSGSYERDTNIRPLDDIDMFAVMTRDRWLENGMLPSPQTVLTKIKNFLDSQDDYKGKVKQSRPCVTVELSNKDFDILPAFSQSYGGGYQIPNYDLSSWTYTYPEDLEKNLNDINKQRSFKVKGVIKAIKYWNRDHNKLIPSYHIEETAINIFRINNFTSYEEGIRIWFSNAELYLEITKFKNYDDYETTKKRISKIKDKLNAAIKKRDEGKEGESIQIWKDIFGKEFPTILPEEAKATSKSLSEGTLKIASGGLLSNTVGRSIPASKGFYGDED